MSAQKAARTDSTLPYMCEVPGLIPSTLEMEAGGSEVQGHPQLYSEFGTRHLTLLLQCLLCHYRLVPQTTSSDKAFLLQVDFAKQFVQ